MVDKIEKVHMTRIATRWLSTRWGSRLHGGFRSLRVLPRLASELERLRSESSTLAAELESLRRENDQLRRDSLRIAELTDVVIERLGREAQT